MKKFIGILLCAVMLLAVLGCAQPGPAHRRHPGLRRAAGHRDGSATRLRSLT
jgi:hypothetical protein